MIILPCRMSSGISNQNIWTLTHPLQVRQKPYIISLIARLVHMEPTSLNVTHADISSTITIPAVTDPVRCARR